MTLRESFHGSQLGLLEQVTLDEQFPIAIVVKRPCWIEADDVHGLTRAK
jgi:hypothetical protein